MRISRIYQAGIYHLGKTITLGESASHHLIRVLRHKEGEMVRLFNGEGVECEARIVLCHKRQVSVEITVLLLAAPESPLAIHLFQGISKGDRMDFSIQKSVELGVREITPVFTARTQFKLTEDRLEKKMAHWRAVMVSATEQSGRATLPILNEAILFEKIAFAELPDLTIMLDPQGSSLFSDLHTASKAAALFVGPEGGFSDAEVTLAQRYHIRSVQCGPRIFRTETASVVAISLLQHRFGDLR